VPYYSRSNFPNPRKEENNWASAGKSLNNLHLEEVLKSHSSVTLNNWYYTVRSFPPNQKSETYNHHETTYPLPMENGTEFMLPKPLILHPEFRFWSQNWKPEKARTWAVQTSSSSLAGGGWWPLRSLGRWWPKPLGLRNGDFIPGTN
jgi:hypothetical protein